MRKSALKTAAGILVALAIAAGVASAQYQAIPNFTGIGAGFNFRQAINQRFGGQAAIAPQVVAFPFASLPIEQDGMILWCKDCQKAVPCAAGGQGAFAFGARGQWICDNVAPLEADLDANSHNITAAASLQAARPGDTQYREALAAGTGIQVGTGAAPPYTAIDENANIAGNVNGNLNVRAPKYGAKGDAASDDTAPIQNTYNDAVAMGANSGSAPAVYLPATPNSCYRITNPLIFYSNVDVFGAGPQSTGICPNFFGADVLLQSNSGFTAPLMSGVSATWQPNHSYCAGAEILDSNGNLQVVGVPLYPNCATSGGSAPSWCAAQGCSTTDGGVTWREAAAAGGGLVSGGGSALDNVNELTWIVWDYDPYLNLSGLNAATIEFYMYPVAYNNSNGNNVIAGVEPGVPEASNIPAFRISVAGGGQGTCGSAGTCLQASMNVGGVNVQVQPTNDPVSLFTVHHIALVLDPNGGIPMVRLFLDGNQVGSAAASGTLGEPYYEAFLFPDKGGGTWPDSGAIVGTPSAYYDSLRVSSSARYTANFTMPAAKFSADGNTLLLVNFPKPPTVGNGQAGYIEGSYHGNTNVFIPLFSAGYNYLEMRIHDFEYCSSKAAGSQPGGMAIGNVIGSAFWRLNCSNAILTGLSAGGSYGDRFDNIHIAMFTAGATKACFHFDAQDNDNIYRDLNCDGGMQSEVVQSGGYGLYVRPYVTDRGNLVYPFVNSAGAAEYIHPFTDMENSNSGFLASLYSNGAWAPVLVYGGQLIAPSPGASGDSFFALNGGQPILDIGSSLDGSPASIVNVISNPASPVTIRDAALPNVPLANSGKSWWVYGKSAAQDLGMKFADLPATAVNGAARYCSDCDPPANPPAACTSSGAKTGAWAHGLNNSWTCAP